jgi:hypothetical protein
MNLLNQMPAIETICSFLEPKDIFTFRLLNKNHYKNQYLEQLFYQQKEVTTADVDRIEDKYKVYISKLYNVKSLDIFKTHKLTNLTH